MADKKDKKDKDKKDKDNKDKKDKDKKDKDNKDKGKKVKDNKDKKDKGKKDKKVKTKDEKKAKNQKQAKMTKEETKKFTEDKKKKKIEKKTNLANLDPFKAEVFADFKHKVAAATEECNSGKRGDVAKQSLVELATAGQTEGLQIWRIEQFSIVPVPKEAYGQFYDGDSYVVLHTIKVSGALSWNLYFWIGENSTQDEYGAAAVWTVQIDDKLGGKAVQHREVQDFESEGFLSLFTPGMQILQGGIASAFKHVDRDEHRVRLLKVKGKKTVRMTEVPAYPISLNSGDVFVLDTKDHIYEWIGKESHVFERQKAGDLCTALRNQRGAKPTIVTIEEARGEDNADFWEHLGGKGRVQTAAEGGDDLSDVGPGVKKLFQLSDASGALKFTEVASGKVLLSMFKSTDVFIFDTGFEVFVWIGSGASAQERSAGLGQAQQYLRECGRPPYFPTTKIQEATHHHTFLSALDK